MPVCVCYWRRQGATRPKLLFSVQSVISIPNLERWNSWQESAFIMPLDKNRRFMRISCPYHLHSENILSVLNHSSSFIFQLIVKNLNFKIVQLHVMMSIMTHNWFTFEQQKNCFLFKQKFGFYHVWLLKTIQVIYHLSFSFIPIQKKAFFNSYSILRVVHSVKKASDQKIPHPLATIYGHTHKLILYFSLFNVGCKE